MSPPVQVGVYVLIGVLMVATIVAKLCLPRCAPPSPSLLHAALTPPPQDSVARAHTLQVEVCDAALPLCPRACARITRMRLCGSCAQLCHELGDAAIL